MYIEFYIFILYLWVEKGTSLKVCLVEEMEKWENRKYSNFPYLCLVGGGEMEKWKDGKNEFV